MRSEVAETRTHMPLRRSEECFRRLEPREDKIEEGERALDLLHSLPNKERENKNRTGA